MTTASHSAKRSERLVQIIALVNDRKHVQLTDLVTELNASPATIRRDVALLEARGLIDRTHGGARAREDGNEIPFNLRDGERRVVKHAIAQFATRQLPAGKHTVGLTGGTTTTEVLRCLDRRDLTIVTNSVSLGLEAATLGQPRVLIAGGALRPNSLELVGTLTEAVFKQTSVDTAILGCDGISVSGGVTTYHDVEARTNHTMLAHSGRVIVVADGSKIGRITTAQLADISEVNILVTDDSANPNELDAIRARGVTVLVVTPTAQRR